MKSTTIFKFLLVALLLFVRATTSQASEGIVSYVASDGGYVFGTAGWTFQPLESISVTSLGGFDYILNAQNQTPISIGLWADDGSLLASNSVTATSLLVNQSRYEPITPVLLTQGLTYHLGAYYPAAGVTVLLAAAPGNGGSVLTSFDIQLGTAVVNTTGFAFPNAPQGGSGSAFLVPNFQFTVVPEPSPAGLLLFAGLIAAWCRSRTQRGAS